MNGVQRVASSHLAVPTNSGGRQVGQEANEARIARGWSAVEFEVLPQAAREYTAVIEDEVGTRKGPGLERTAARGDDSPRVALGGTHRWPPRSRACQARELAPSCLLAPHGPLGQSVEPRTFNPEQGLVLEPAFTRLSVETTALIALSSLPGFPRLPTFLSSRGKRRERKGKASRRSSTLGPRACSGRRLGSLIRPRSQTPSRTRARPGPEARATWCLKP